MHTISVVYSVVVPVYRSANTLPELVQRISLILKEVGESFEIIMIDDCGGDDSWSVLQSLRKDNPVLRIIRLTKNFGQHNAIMCGFNNCRGKYVITIDDDLQNPPEEIPKLIEKIKDGYDIVYGVFDSKKHSFFRNFGSNIIQVIYKKTFGLSNNLTSYRILRREIVDCIVKYDKNFTFLDGLIAWYTKNIATVEVAHAPRQEGRSGYSLRKLLSLSMNLFTNFTVIPLRISAITGILFSIIGLTIGLYMMAKYFFLGIPVMGYTSLILSITILSGIQLFMIGIIGEYVGKILLNINDKPQYAIRELIDTDVEKNVLL